MCIIIAAPPGKRIPRNVLLDALFENPDGAGYVFAHRGELVMDRHHNEGERIVDQFLKFQKEHPETWGLFHSRIATQGGVNEVNTHPFLVPGKPWALVHNGVMPLKDGPWSNRSDSRILAEDHVARMTWADMLTWKDETEKWLSQNKVCILSANRERGGRCIIFNEGKGHWDQRSGIWFSHYQSGGRTRKPYSSSGWKRHEDGHWGPDTSGAPDRTHTTTQTTTTKTTTAPGKSRGPGGELVPFTGQTRKERKQQRRGAGGLTRTLFEQRLAEAANMLAVSIDDIRNWCQQDPAEVKKMVDELLGDTQAADDPAPGEAVLTEDDFTEDARPDTEVPIIAGKWDVDTGLYMGDDGSIWSPHASDENMLTPRNRLAHKRLESVPAH